MNKLMCLIWGIVYRKWLWNSYYKNYDTVIRVKGWRTALIEDKARHRSTMTPIFLWFK